MPIEPLNLKTNMTNSQFFIVIRTQIFCRSLVPPRTHLLKMKTNGWEKGSNCHLKNVPWDTHPLVFGWNHHRLPASWSRRRLKWTGRTRSSRPRSRRLTPESGAKVYHSGREPAFCDPKIDRNIFFQILGSNLLILNMLPMWKSWFLKWQPCHFPVMALCFVV